MILLESLYASVGIGVLKALGAMYNIVSMGFVSV